MNQLKSVNYYIYHKDKYIDAFNTEGEEIECDANSSHLSSTLPSLRSNKMSQIGKVCIETRHLLSEPDEKSVLSQAHGPNRVYVIIVGFLMLNQTGTNNYVQKWPLLFVGSRHILCVLVCSIYRTYFRGNSR